MNDFVNKLRINYNNGTEGVKIIYLCVISSIIFWVLNFIFIKIFSFSLDRLVLLSSHDIFPFFWTIFTFSFIHEGFLNLLLAMLMIYFTERIFRIYFNGESFLKFFILGNLFGGISFLIISSLLNLNQSIYFSGAISGVYSILFAIISYNPKMEVSLFPLPIRFPIYILGLIIIGFDCFSLVSNSQNISLLVPRLAGAGFGYLYMKYFQKGNDFLGGIMFYFFKIINFKFKSNKFKTKRGGTSRTSSYKTDEQYNEDKIEKQKQIDKILDKISEKGYDSLTKEEKDFLFRSSK